MIVVAIFFDVLQFGVNFIIGPGQIGAPLMEIFAQLTFWLWFKLNGISYTSSKRLASVAGGMLVGVIPFVDMLPELTIEIIIILSTITIEDAVANKVPGGAKLVSGVKALEGERPKIKSS